MDKKGGWGELVIAIILGSRGAKHSHGVQTVMSLASPALLLVRFYTHSLRCGLEECHQLRWLCPTITQLEH